MLEIWQKGLGKFEDFEDLVVEGIPFGVFVGYVGNSPTVCLVSNFRYHKNAQNLLNHIPLLNYSFNLRNKNKRNTLYF